jgi:hypothetical protein
LTGKFNNAPVMMTGVPSRFILRPATGVSQKIKKFGNLIKLGISVSLRHSDRS